MLNLRNMEVDLARLKAALKPIADIVADHVANACEDDEMIMLTLRVGDLRQLGSLHDDL